jgi:hypothetical protein
MEPSTRHSLRLMAKGAAAALERSALANLSACCSPRESFPESRRARGRGQRADQGMDEKRGTCDNKGQNAATTSTACAVCDERGICIVEPVSTEEKRKGDRSGVYQDVRESAS